MHIPKLIAFLKSSSGIPEPVSYTHLDVYKRQMYDSRIKLSEEVIAEVKNYFPQKIYNTIIPRNVRLSEAPSYGKPILFYDPECKGAQAYKNFTKEVIENGTKRTG